MRDDIEPLTAAQTTTPAPVDPTRWLELYGDSLYNFALKRLNQHELAEEAVQETLLAGVRALDQFSGSSSERTWLFSILRRKVFDVYRDRSHRSRSPKKLSLDDERNPEWLLFNSNGSWQASALIGQACHLEFSELEEIVHRCLRKLPSIQASIFLMKVLQEKNSEDICRELEISEANYWARLHRAKLSLAKCVSESWSVA